MNDDYRVRAQLADAASAGALAERLRSGDHGLPIGEDGSDRMIVSVDDRDVFVYAGTHAQASAAASLVERLARASGWTCTVTVARWHPAAEEWEDADAPLPGAASEDEAAERAEVIGRERAESRALGAPKYEVRVSCASHGDTSALAERLESEGVPSLRRWRYLLVGAPDEESARALAERLVAEAPPGATVEVEASIAAVEAGTPPNPFAVFGGLGG